MTATAEPQHESRLGEDWAENQKGPGLWRPGVAAVPFWSLPSKVGEGGRHFDSV